MMLVWIALFIGVAGICVVGLLSTFAGGGGRVRQLEAENARLREELTASQACREDDLSTAQESRELAPRWSVLPAVGEETIAVAGQRVPSDLVRDIEDLVDKPALAVKLTTQRLSLPIEEAQRVVAAVHEGNF